MLERTNGAASPGIKKFIIFYNPNSPKTIKKV